MRLTGDAKPRTLIAMRVDIYSDTICPWCFIGKRRLERTLAERENLSVEVQWHPYQLNPDMPREGLDSQTYLTLKFGSPSRARQVYDTIARAGHSERIAFNFDAITRTPNTLDSHRLIRFANQAGDGYGAAVVEELFRAYFMQGEDIGNLGVLGRVARRCGLDGVAAEAFLASGADTDEVRAEDLRARRMGVEGAPCFIVDGRYAISGAQEPEAFYPLLDLEALD